MTSQLTQSELYLTTVPFHLRKKDRYKVKTRVKSHEYIFLNFFGSILYLCTGQWMDVFLPWTKCIYQFFMPVSALKSLFPIKQKDIDI